MRVTTIAVAIQWGFLLLLSGPLSGAQPDPPAKDHILIRAFACDRGNLKAMAAGEGYADTEAVVINSGVVPNTAEYDIDFPATAKYEVFARYAALQSRPVDIYLDGVLLERGFKSVTGSWQSSSAIWEKQCDAHITQGRHTIRLQCPGPCIPHIVALRFDSPVAFPKDWKLDRPNARKLDGMAALPETIAKYGFESFVGKDGHVHAPKGYNPIIPFEKIPPPNPMAERLLEYALMADGKYHLESKIEKTPEGWVARLSVKVDEKRTDTADLVLSTERIGRMLEHAGRLSSEFRLERPEIAGMLDELSALTADKGDSASKWHRVYDLYLRAYKLKNSVALQNPLLDFDKLLFVKRQTYNTSHIYTTYFDGSRRPGGNIYLLSPVRPSGGAAPLVKELGDDGIYRDPDLSWDGRKVLFSHKADLKTPCRIYEVSIDGSNLRQITNTEYDDIDPCYLPDGRIAFVSTRCRRVVLCHNAFTVSVLYTMNPDGSDVRCISPNTINEFTPSVAHDGRILFSRWEYVDKHVGNNQSLWAVDPQGSRAVHIAGEHWGPMTYWGPRSIPNSQLIACILAPHMPIAMGPVGLIDPLDVCSSPARYRNVTPELPPAHHFGWNRDDVGYYADVFPLSDKYFIVSYSYAADAREPAGYGLYLLDIWNNRDLIYRDPVVSAFEAFPVKARPRPAVIAPQPSDKGTGAFLVLDVYRGLKGIERGTVKYLRVVEEIPKPVSSNTIGFGLQNPAISNYGHLALKRILGTVPVEEDGSAYFRVPGGAGVYFSALDADMMEIQRMRALTYAPAGQTISCVGCHDRRQEAPPNVAALALRKPPVEITPPEGGPRAPDFAYDVQPVLNKHCLKCHGGEKTEGGVDLSPDYTNVFNVAYETLTDQKRGFVSFVDHRSSETLPLRLPKHYGSHASKLITVLRTTHKDRVRLTPWEFHRIAEWIDCNAPYYGTYVYSRPGTIGGRGLVYGEPAKVFDRVYNQRCVSCHPKDNNRIRRIVVPGIERSPSLMAPLAKSGGGAEACGKPVFADKNAPDFKALLAALAQIRDDIKKMPREDMLASRPPMVDENCNYRYR